MKVVTLNSIVGAIRARRGYRTFLSKFINECEIVDAIPIPKGTTNGDMFKAMFPNIEVKPQMSYGFKNGIKVRVYKDEFSVFDLWFPTDWWNAPYKKEVEE